MSDARNRKRTLRTDRGRRPRRIGVALGTTTALFVSLAAADPALAETRTAGEELARAERALAAGDITTGLEAAEAALARSRTNDATELAAQLLRGRARLALGQPEAARRDLTALAGDERAAALGLARVARLELGNLALSEGALAEARTAFDAVAQESIAAGDPRSALQAALNALRATAFDPSLALNEATGRLPAIENALRAWQDALAPTRPDPREASLFRIHIGHSLVLALEPGSEDAATRAASSIASASPRNRTAQAARTQLDRALHLADSVPDPTFAAHLRAQALGELGALYAASAQREEALALTERALAQAARAGTPALAVRWNAQAARLARALGRPDLSYRYSARAVDGIAEHRAALHRDLRASDPRDAGERLNAIVREHLDLLFTRAREAQDETARRADLARAQDTLERLKGDELRDHFEDDCVTRYKARKRSVDEASSKDLVVYPFVLDDRLELLVSRGGELSQIAVPVERETLLETVRAFRVLVEKRTTRQYLRPARQLYDWLVRPLEGRLAAQPARTLVFVPDGALRSIPFAALHDGEQFLIEKLALGLTPGLELTDPAPLSLGGTNALLAGLSESVAGFDALPNVVDEIDAIHALIGGDRLVDAAFSGDRLAERITREDYGLIHIASHAQFSDGGFVLTRDGRLPFDEFAEAIAYSKFRENPLEILILSACETAAGDDGSALGLAGLAIQAGARSALGSLWQVNDAATADFMGHFYRGLAEPGLTRAEASRRAQRALLEDARYGHPYYWAPFLLLNSWL